MTHDLGVLAQIAYDAGITPLDFAEEQVTIHIAVHTATAGAPPGMFLAAQMSPDAVARRILGALLDAGWQPPVWPIPEPAQEAP